MSTPDTDPRLRDARNAEVAGYALAAAALQTETRKQLDNVINEVNDVLKDAAPDVTVVPRNWRETEYERAAKVEELLNLGVLPELLPLPRRLSIFESLIDKDDRISETLHDERTVAQKGLSYYRRLLSLQVRSRR